MKLQTYLEQKKISRTEFAELVGCNPQAVWVWIQGKSKPSGRLMYEIEKATKRKVTMKDFL